MGVNTGGVPVSIQKNLKLQLWIFQRKTRAMAPRHNVDEGNSASEDSPEDEPKPAEEPTAQSEPTKKRIRLRDTTSEHIGEPIAFIGGVRAPKKK